MEQHTPPARITFLSHAATTATRRVAFPLDEQVDELELKKISAIGWTPPRATQICCGPEQRVRQTAEALGLTSRISKDLADCDYGSWRGKSFDELQQEDPDGIMHWLTDVEAVPHGGESIVALVKRTERWLETQRDTGHTIAVTHPALIRAAIVTSLNAPPGAFWRIEISPLSLTDLRFNGRSWTLRSSGCLLRST